MNSVLEKTEKNRGIDALKGICIIFVIISHYNWDATERLCLLFPFWIDMAVPLFMIMSGWVNSASMSRKKINSFSEAYSCKLIIPRLIKYTVPYSLIFVIEVWLELMVNNNEISLVSLFLIFLNGGWGAGSYYYPVMIQFTFVIPVVYFLIRKYDWGGGTDMWDC